MLVIKEIEIDMGHRVPNHKSKCKNPHGHRYKIEVAIGGELITTKGNSSEGMIVDFGDLKKIMMDVIDKTYDHSYTLYKDDKYIRFFNIMKADGCKINIVDFIPTAENLAKHWYKLLDKKLMDKNIVLVYVRVYETPTSAAVYTGVMD